MKSMEFEQKLDKTINNPRHAKKNSNRKQKSNHKHEYIEVLLFILRQNPVYSNKVEEKAYRTKVCLHCGKVHSLDLMEELRRNGSSFYISMSREEMVAKYPDHLVFDLGNHVYKHFFDLDRGDPIDIRNMYRDQIQSFISETVDISDNDISYGLKNNMKPDRVAEMLKSKTQHS